MQPEQRQRLVEIKTASKQGQYVAPQDLAFCEQMFTHYPDEYSKVEGEVFEATRPFGSVGFDS